ncbi:hypothetical protein BKK79_13750 [Cupriavidus sp. USMAA2-4]|uniref:hypothetical protein n=1 Tax=Cupriavidus sp. USMAA2-4 TaxID=876364 RepID=UPI0008A69270|nr:hypothetical protein [Cupriavidus sp. USMAA2-4]AOY92718.1 hypothetical protein BKK79_13750 [Cupriavidus sp. USMAA2-4]
MNRRTPIATALLALFAAPVAVHAQQDPSTRPPQAAQAQQAPAAAGGTLKEVTLPLFHESHNRGN